MARSLLHRGVVFLDDVTDDLVLEYLLEVTFKGGEARDPSSSTIQRRRWAVRSFFETARSLGLTERAVGIDLTVPDRPRLLTRPLITPEVRRCEEAARMTLWETRGPAVLALAEAGGDNGEIAAVAVRDVDLRSGTVSFRGVSGHRARQNVLTPWGCEALRQRVKELGPQHESVPVTVNPGTSVTSATASISSALTDVLRLAFLTEDPRVKPRSIRAWSGRQVWERTSDITAAAIWLGVSSLDATAATIGLHWEAM